MLPQLDASTYAGQIFWLAVCFLILYFGIANAVLPRIRAVLQQRAFRIESDIQKADEFRKEAEAILAEYDAMLADSRANAKALTEKARKGAEAEIVKNEERAAEAVNAKIADARERVEVLRENAQKHIEETKAETGRLIARHVFPELDLKL